MYATIMNVTFIDRSAAESELPELISQTSGIPGFVAGYWVALSADKGSATIVFESEEAAQAVAAQAGSAPAVTVTIDSLEVGQVMGHA
jgi:hypothetical protein